MSYVLLGLLFLGWATIVCWRVVERIVFGLFGSGRGDDEQDHSGRR
jgi:hypothetical protein